MLADWVFSIVDRLGVLGVGLLILLENVIPPIPSEVILPLAGFRARAGAFNVVAVWAAATAGAVLGAALLYGLGRWLGYERLYRLAGHRWFILSSRRDIERGQDLMERHGGKIVLLARCVPLLRSIVSIPAGVVCMPVWRFVALTSIGTGIWNALFIWLGWTLNENWGVVKQYLAPISYTIIGLVLVGLGVLIYRRMKVRSEVEPAQDHR